MQNRNSFIARTNRSLFASCAALIHPIRSGKEGSSRLFGGQIDGATEINRECTEAFAKLLEAEESDVVLAHWPLDTHNDHHIASLLTFRAFASARKHFALYFYEILTGSRTPGFVPSVYVDITQVQTKKQQACALHSSRNVEKY